MKQQSFLNMKGAGRPAKNDRGIRHIARDEFNRLTVLHLTIKIDKSKAGLKNKQTLKVMWNAIKKARMIGLKIIHYTLEYDHVHLLVEADSKAELGSGMQSFGITFSKGINKLKKAKGQVYKTRYHLRKLKTPAEVKNVIQYILGNSVKHKTSSFINQYNSLVTVSDFSVLYPGFELMLESTIERSPFLRKLSLFLNDLLPAPDSFLIIKNV